MFEPRHNIVSNVRADIRNYVVSWLKHSRESKSPVLGPISRFYYRKLDLHGQYVTIITMFSNRLQSLMNASS